MLLDWKKKYCQNDYTTKGNLQIQRNPYQITNRTFYRMRTKYFKAYLKARKTRNSPKPSRERTTELEESGSLTSGYTAKPQYSAGTKTEIYISGTEQKAKN